MKRTKTPEFRKKIDKKDVSFKIISEEQKVAITIKNLSKYKFLNNCKLFFEVYNKNFFYRSSLQDKTVQSFVTEKERTVLEDFDLPEIKRSRLKFRLKIVHPIRSHLLGVVENVKESGLGESALPVTFENIDQVYQISWDDGEPELTVNQELKEIFHKIKPVISESILKTILVYMTNKDTYCSEEVEELWSRIVHKNLSEIKETREFDSKIEKIDDIVKNFSKKHDTVKQILKAIG